MSEPLTLTDEEWNDLCETAAGYSPDSVWKKLVDVHALTTAELAEARRKLALEEADAEDMRVLHETSKRQAARILELSEIVSRLQADNLELASIREYLVSLRHLHSACGQLVEGVLKRGRDADPVVYDRAVFVEKSLAVLGQHKKPGCS